MSTRKRNRPLLLRVARRIKGLKNRYQLNMGCWGMMSARKDICDTVACVAGWTVVEAFGHKNIEFPGAAEHDFVAVSARRYEALREKLRLPKLRHAPVKGKVMIDIPVVARQALGLTFNESNKLFYGPGSWPVDLRLMTEREGAVTFLKELAGPAPRRKRRDARVDKAASRNQKDARIGVASPKGLDAPTDEAPEPDLVLV